MVELLFPLTLKRGYERRDLYTLEVLVCGVWSNGLRSVNFLASLMYLYYYGFHHPSTPKWVSPYGDCIVKNILFDHNKASL